MIWVILKLYFTLTASNCKRHILSGILQKKSKHLSLVKLRTTDPPFYLEWVGGLECVLYETVQALHPQVILRPAGSCNTHYPGEHHHSNLSELIKGSQFNCLLVSFHEELNLSSIHYDMLALVSTMTC